MPSGGSTNLALPPDRPLGKLRPPSRVGASEMTAQPEAGFRSLGVWQGSGFRGPARAAEPELRRQGHFQARSDAVQPAQQRRRGPSGRRRTPGEAGLCTARQHAQMSAGALSLTCQSCKASAPGSGLATPFSSTPPRWRTSTCTLPRSGCAGQGAAGQLVQRGVLPALGCLQSPGRPSPRCAGCCPRAADQTRCAHLAACKALAGQVCVALAGVPSGASVWRRGQALAGRP